MVGRTVCEPARPRVGLGGLLQLPGLPVAHRRWPTAAEFVLDHGLLAGLPPSLRWVAAMGLFVRLAVGAGAVLGVLIERPALRLRERLFPARSTALGQVGDDRVAPRPDLVGTNDGNSVAEPVQMGVP